MSIFLGGVEVALLVVNGSGAGQIVFSASPTDDEHQLPAGLVDGSLVKIGELLAGALNLSQPA
jgi:hypothetical protein